MDISQKDFGLLLALDALLEEESVSAAALRLGLSQPAMSSQLRRLRDLFNDPLLTPSGRRLVATSRALELKAELHRHLQGLDALVRERSAFDPVSTRKTFRIIATDYAHSILSTSLAKELGSKAPLARLAFLPFAPTSVWRMLEKDDADMAFVTGMKLPEAKYSPGIRESFCVIQRKGHPRGVGPMSLEDFCSCEHVLVSPEGGGFVGAADKVLDDLGYSRKIVISLPSFLLAPTLVARTDYICLLPRRLAAQYDDVIDTTELPFPSPTYQVDLLWHPRRQHDPAHTWFRGLMKEQISAA